MVTAPASTGITAISRYAVISQDQQNSGIFSKFMPGARMFMMVTTILIAPMIDEAPMRCTAKISMGTASPACRPAAGTWSTRPAGRRPA